MKELRPIEARSIYQELQVRIKEYILDNHLKPGDHLPSETQLATQLNVSRSVMREALRTLEALGVIRSRRGGGRYVAEFSLDPVLKNLGYSMLYDKQSIQEILDVRERLEAGFVGDAIAAMDEGTLTRLRDLVGLMQQKAVKREEFMEEDLAFHRDLFLVTGNRLLIKLLDVFWVAYRNLRDAKADVVKDPQATARDHEEILQAVEAGDTQQAQQRLVNHFFGIRERLAAADLSETHEPF